jgi:hypothetical protein
MMSASLVRELRARAIEGFVSLPKRGVEIGGILFGHMRGESVQIEGFEEAPCEHRYGPSYALSDADRARLSELLAQRQGGGSLPVAGFFRSFTSREPLIEAADEEFVREHFPHGDFLFLMLQPLSPQSCVASFRLFREGELLPESEHPPFAFDPAQMEPGESAVTAPAAPTAPTPPVLEVPAPVLPPPYRARDEGPRWAEETSERTVKPPARSRWWLPVAICLISGIGGAVIYELWNVAREPRWVELHLDARPAGRQLDVSWDANAPRAVNATRALLGVTDGGEHHDIELTPAQMRAGKYSYTPAHGDIALRLILYGKGVGVAGDAVHVTAIPNVVETAATDGTPSNATAAASADRAAPPAETVTPPTSARPAVLPSTVHEVQPRIPAGIRSRLQGEVVIPVIVQVNEKGRVTGAAAAVRGGDGLHRYLAEQAEKAARQWRFTPAKTSRGTRVASSKTVHFVFEP